jgi:YrbI family 3-deoxy-D-manno-octulosonate 8-phosphate phosphatase
MKNNKISLSDIEAFIFDFDGVLTNNLVHISQDGQEWVSCSRADGLAFDVLRKLKIPAYILSTEKNLVVTERAIKLKIQALQGVSDKVKALKLFSTENRYKLNRVLYVGNDLNDYEAMKLCGYSVCPSDSHNKIKQIADIVLKTQGGKGVVRELVEDVFEIDLIKILYN